MTAKSIKTVSVIKNVTLRLANGTVLLRAKDKIPSKNGHSLATPDGSYHQTSRVREKVSEVLRRFKKETDDCFYEIANVETETVQVG